jgi:RNA polymerase-interacting CarD/CdnL/TRCF family regulator
MSLAFPSPAAVGRGQMKNTNKNLGTGDKIVDLGRVYRIFKVKKRRGAKGALEKVLHYRPYFKTDKNKDVVCTIPLKNIKLANIRKPISQRQLGKIFQMLSAKPNGKKAVKAVKLKSEINLNDPFKTARALKKLWLDKVDQSTSFTLAKKRVYKAAVRRLTEEVAFVGRSTPAKAKEKIFRRLEKLRDG